MDLVTLTVDGREVKVRRGVTVLNALRELGIYVPTLCHHPDLTPFGACRLCIVEIEGMRGYPTSCTTTVQDGMVVRSNTPELQELRRTILELLLARHPYTCLVCERRNECRDFRTCMRKTAVTTGCRYCPKDGECELQQAVEAVGLTEVRFPVEYPDLPVYREPFFDRDYNLCILCGRCVRVCDEIRGVGAVSFAFRAARAVIGTAFDLPLERVGCQFCGACVDVCPTGALVARSEKWEKPERHVQTICPYCGVGCHLVLGVRDNRIVRVRAGRDNGVNDGQLCVKGRFGLDFVHSEQRLTTPLIRKDGTLVPAEWDEALDLVAAKLRQYRGDGFGLLASAKCTNEENYLLSKFARAVMQTNNVDHCARLCHASTVTGLAMAFGSGAMTNPIQDIRNASCVFLIGSNPTENHPIVGLEIKKAKSNGAALIVANPRRIPLCDLADLWLRHRPGTDVALLLGMARVIVDEGLADLEFIRERCEGYEEFLASLSGFSLEEAASLTGVPAQDIAQAARTYARRKPASIVYAMGITQHAHGTDNVLALANLAMLTGNVGKPSSGVNPLRGQNNVQGACDMGALPNVLTGYQPVADPAVREKFARAWGAEVPAEPGLTVTEMFGAALEGRLKAMYIVGENPLLSDPDADHVRAALEKLEFLVVQDIFLSETAALAHVVLPAASFAEKDGTFTNTERRVQRVRKALTPPGKARTDLEIVCQLARKMGAPGFDYQGPAEVMEEIARLTPSYGGITFARLEQGGLQWPCPSADHPGTARLHEAAFTRGKGKFHPVRYTPPAELPDDEYPFVLTTGRSLFQFHTGTMTRKASGLNYIRGEELVEINPEDACALGISDGDPVEVTSRRGKVRARARVTDESPPGVVFMTFHFAETPTNVLTNPVLDPLAKIPELKVCAVRINKVSGG